ncbi:RNA recognition motif-containing protein [Cryptosporidium felis]|nr:RNA recognition motif-containing protein [Cryptosporidium felis]
MSAIGMSSDLLKFFQARPPLPHIPHPKRKPHKQYTGVADLLSNNPDLFDKISPLPPMPFIDIKNNHETRKYEKIRAYREELEHKIVNFDPMSDSDKKTGDPYNTLFIARLNYDTSEKTLRRELEVYGNILNLKIVRDSCGESRGYAFVEFESEESLRLAYYSLNRKEIDGWKVLVDVERGRTVENWLPKRLGGGLGIVRGREIPNRNVNLGMHKQANYGQPDYLGGSYKYREYSNYRSNHSRNPNDYRHNYGTMDYYPPRTCGGYPQFKKPRY